jgi:O-antigen/teichoic acid export membrane protein|tara:strand:- start:13570 stop:14733 length:1164 start_codon:yes stop_codon:yes gene_type:complete
MVDDSKNLKDKISAYKGLGVIGSADIIGTAITGIFWLFIASFIEVEEYGQIHYFLGIAGIAYIITLFGTQQTITVYSAKKVNVVSTLFFLSLIAVSVTALVVFFIYTKPDLSLLVIGYVVNDLAIGYLLGKKLFGNYSKYILTQRMLVFILGFGFYFIFGVEGILYALALSYVHFLLLIYKGLKDSRINFSSLSTRSGFIINNYALSVVGGFRGNIDKIIIAPLLGFILLGNLALALQFYVVLMVIPQIVFKYTLSHDASGITTTKVKFWTFMFAIATCVTTILVSPHIIPLFFEKFVDVVEAIQILSIGVIPATASLFYMSKFLGQEKSKNPLIGLSIQVTITVIGIIILGQIYGIVGIAISYVLASSGNFTYLFFTSRSLAVSQN